MRKIKITEEQANILKNLKEDEIESIRTGSQFSTAPKKIEKNFKDTGIKLNESPIPEIQELAIMVLDGIKAFYQDPSTTGIDPKWAAMGFNAGEVRTLLTTFIMGIPVIGKLPMMKDIIPKLKDFVNVIAGKAEEKEKERGVNTYKESGGVHIEEDDNLPTGVSSNDSHFNQPEKTRPSSSKFSLFNVLWMDKEIAILESRNRLYAIYYIGIEGVEDYAEREIMGYGKDEDGSAYPEYHEDFEIDEKALEGFINDNYDTIGIGAGYEDWEHDSSRITKMDDEMKADILGTWNNPELQQIFNNMDETTAADSGSYVPGIDGNYNTNVDKDMLPSRQIDVDETTTVASVGGDSGTFAYDAPAGDGDDFWTAGNKMNKKSKGGNVIRKEQLEEDAKTDTQYPKGTFVEMPACSKLDNNKEAQNGGCNQGAGANIKYKSSKNSVISNEALYNEVAEKTGRPVNEVKTIIDGYNNK